MSFVMKTINSIKEVVTINVPADKGKSTRATIIVEFKKLPVSEAKAIIEEAGEAGNDDLQILKDNILGIEGLLDEEKNKIEFSSDVLDELVEMEYVRRPLINKLMEVFVGRETLKRKN